MRSQQLRQGAFSSASLGETIDWLLEMSRRRRCGEIVHALVKAMSESSGKSERSSEVSDAPPRAVGCFRAQQPARTRLSAPQKQLAIAVY